MSRDSAEASRASRFQAGLPATIQLDGEEVECRAHNLSRSGTLLRGNIPMLDVAETWVTLRSSTGDLQFTAVGRIVRDDRTSDGAQTLLAVEFLDVPAADLPTLEALVARVVEGVSPAAINDIPDGASPQQIRATLETVPLPHRMQLASRGLPREREIMIHDSNVQVIDALARNPSLLLNEVLAILRMRNIMSSTVQSIAKDPRWRGNELVQVQLVGHRSMPLALAQQMIATMPVASLRRVIQASDLSPALRTKILDRLPGGHRP